MSMPGIQICGLLIPIPTKRNKSFLEKWLDARQEMFKLATYQKGKEDSKNLYVCVKGLKSQLE